MTLSINRRRSFTVLSWDKENEDVWISSFFAKHILDQSHIIKQVHPLDFQWSENILDAVKECEVLLVLQYQDFTLQTVRSK